MGILLTEKSTERRGSVAVAVLDPAAQAGPQRAALKGVEQAVAWEDDAVAERLERGRGAVSGGTMSAEDGDVG